MLEKRYFSKRTTDGAIVTLSTLPNKNNFFKISAPKMILQRGAFQS